MATLLEVAHEAGAALQIAQREAQAVLGELQLALELATAHGRAGERLAHRAQRLGGGVRPDQGVADGRVQLMGDPRHERAQAGQRVPLHQLLVGLLQLPAALLHPGFEREIQQPHRLLRLPALLHLVLQGAAHAVLLAAVGGKARRQRVEGPGQADELRRGGGRQGAGLLAAAHALRLRLDGLAEGLQRFVEPAPDHAPQQQQRQHQTEQAHAQHPAHDGTQDAVDAVHGNDAHRPPIRPRHAAPGDEEAAVRRHAVLPARMTVHRSVRAGGMGPQQGMDLVEHRVLQLLQGQLPLRLGDALAQLRVGDQLPVAAQNHGRRAHGRLGVHDLLQQRVDGDVVPDRAHPAPLPVQRLDDRDHPGLDLAVEVDRRPEALPLRIARGVRAGHGRVAEVVGRGRGAAAPVDPPREHHEALLDEVRVDREEGRHECRPLLEQQLVADDGAAPRGGVGAVGTVLQIEGGRVFGVDPARLQPPDAVRLALEQLGPAPVDLGVAGQPDAALPFLPQALDAGLRLQKDLTLLRGMQADGAPHHRRHHLQGGLADHGIGQAGEHRQHDGHQQAQLQDQLPRERLPQEDVQEPLHGPPGMDRRRLGR